MKIENQPVSSQPTRQLSGRIDAVKILQHASHISWQVVYDVFALIVAYEGALLLRMSAGEWAKTFPYYLEFLPIFVGIGLSVFWATGIYRTLWRYASVDAVAYISGAALLTVVFSSAIISLLQPGIFAWSIFVIQSMLLAAIVGGGRIMLRYLKLLASSRSTHDAKPILIYGAGDAGDMIARELVHHASHSFTVVGFVDDDPSKAHKSIHGMPIYGGRDQIGRVVSEKGVKMVLIAMPSLSGIQLREILSDLRNQLDDGVELRTLPPISELVDGKVSIQQIREFDVRDLLRREPIELDLQRVVRLIKGKSVLISGAGGSIGSEICQQVAQCKPTRLVIFDISEASLYQIHDSLTRAFPDLRIVPVVGSITQRWLVERVFQEHAPNLVFHAAAYKHVPLMEENPLSALVNNVVGTRVLTAVSAENDVDRFVMISTDKAVRPTNIMGATKRLCELVVEAQVHSAGSVYCAVRFGNVMGSSGSVIPKFEQQIRDGGPVTVTDRDITRYFMLTSEAVQLVLQAASLNHDYAIYFLDMGEPIKIDALARDMIQLHGFVPDRDIKIEYTNLRPGEKLHEELCHDGDGLPTPIEKIWIAETPALDPTRFLQDLDELLQSCYKLKRNELYHAVSKLVLDFQPTVQPQEADSMIGGSRTTERRSSHRDRGLTA